MVFGPGGHTICLRGALEVDCSRALAAGLRFRTLEETVRDTLAWCRAGASDYEWKAGLRGEREAEVLRAWREAVSDS